MIVRLRTILVFRLGRLKSGRFECFNLPPLDPLPFLLYSYLSASTGLELAAFSDCKLTIKMVNISVIKPDNT